MRILDLTHTIAESMPVYPGTELPARKQANSYEKGGFKESLLCLYSRSGRTPDDAPLRAVAILGRFISAQKKKTENHSQDFFRSVSAHCHISLSMPVYRF